MITVEKLEKGTYFDDAFKISFRYDPTTVAKVKELAERRYLPEDRAWEIPAHELPALIEKVGLSNIKSEEAVVQALNTKEIEDKREATQERLKGIKPVRDFDFKTAPLPHQIEAFNYGMEKNSLLIGDEQGLGKTKESIDICVARKKELIKTLIVCGVNSVKYNWEKEIQIHSNEGCVMVDGKTMDVRVQQLNDWYRGSSYFGVINIESLRNEKIQDALYLGIKDGYIGAIIVDEIHNLSKGYKQRVGLAQAILGFPEIIILDEPTVGLDPKQIIEIRELIRELAKEHTVILSSHILAEIQEVCDYIMIISKGKLVASDTPENLEKLLTNQQTVEILAKGNEDTVRKVIGTIGNVQKASVEHGKEEGTVKASLFPKDGKDIRETVFMAFAQEGCPLLMLYHSRTTLEDVFLELTQGSTPAVAKAMKDGEKKGRMAKRHKKNAQEEAEENELTEMDEEPEENAVPTSEDEKEDLENDSNL